MSLDELRLKRPPPGKSWNKVLSLLSPDKRREFVDGLSASEIDLLQHDWWFNGRREQLIPDGNWFLCLAIAGRSWGKTRCGSEWVLEQVRRGARNIALVGPTAPDTRDIMVLGPSGIIECAKPEERPTYKPSRRAVYFPDGAVGHLFSADEYERLRGHQGEVVWLDEFAAWRYTQKAWETLVFGARLGKEPHILVTTTPKPIRMLRELLKREGDDTIVIHGTTWDNADNLPNTYLKEIKKFDGSRLGQQEIYAEIMEELEGALWTPVMIERTRGGRLPTEWHKRVIGVDPPTSAMGDCGIVAAGEAAPEDYWVLDDLTVSGSPATWAARVAYAAQEHCADYIVAEVNQGGDMVEEVIRNHTSVPVRQVRATKGKLLRAEPISDLYDRNCVKHRLEFPWLENEMEMYDGRGKSPNRLDALVWALWDLAIDRKGGWAGVWSRGQGALVRGLTWGTR